MAGAPYHQQPSSDVIPTHKPLELLWLLGARVQDRCWLEQCNAERQTALAVALSFQHPAYGMTDIFADEAYNGFCEHPPSSAFMLGARELLKELLLIEVPSIKACALALRVAIESSWRSLSAWVSVVMLLLSPLAKFLAVLARAAWPHLRGAAIAFWKHQASLPTSTLYAEAAVVVLVIAALLLRRFIVRQRYIPRARRRIHLFRSRLNSAYRSFTASVERKFRVSARVFPHVVYWTATGSLAWLAPDLAGKLRVNFTAFLTVTWPTLYALYLALLVRSQDRPNDPAGANGDGQPAAAAAATAAPAGSLGGHERASSGRATPVRTPNAKRMNSGLGSVGTPARSPGSVLARGTSVSTHDVDRVLMYWVVFTVTTCCSLVPFVPSALEMVATPYARSLAFFLVLWIHLPGPGSGLQVVYALLEPLVHTYVRDLRMPEDGYAGALQRMQEVLVFLRIMTKENAEVLVDNITDSWMLLPVPLLLVTPSFITSLGCAYAGLVVPSFNSIKALGRRANLNGRAGLATSAGGARVRWLTYWVAYGGWLHVARVLGGLLRILPLATHAQLLLLLWLQVPLFRGGGRILDFGERCMDRWTYGDLTESSGPPRKPLPRQPSSVDVQE